jgi:hypothetical protein
MKELKVFLSMTLATNLTNVFPVLQSVKPHTYALRKLCFNAEPPVNRA